MKKGICLLMILCLLLSLFAACAQAEGAQVPDLDIKRRPIPDNEAMAFLKKIGVGWNLGNTFDAIKGGWNKFADEMTVETSWVGIRTEERMIEALQNAGFTAIRVPVTWYNHMDANGNVKEEWMARVKEVVDYVLDEGLYCIINVHHDTGADGKDAEGNVTHYKWIKADKDNYEQNVLR